MVSEHNVIIIVVLNIMETLIVLRKIICSSNLHDSEINVKGRQKYVDLWRNLVRCMQVQTKRQIHKMIVKLTELSMRL